jgi:hypothetical protein
MVGPLGVDPGVASAHESNKTVDEESSLRVDDDTPRGLLALFPGGSAASVTR